VLIDRSDQPLLGAGEASTTPVAAAIANAVFDATGVRLRTVPFTAARVKSAMSAPATQP
jgi:nicotinate dehydrogenase subunit B